MADLPNGPFEFAIPMTIVDKHGHTLDGDFDPKGAGGCDHRDTPEWKAEHPRKKEKKMAKETEKPQAIVQEPVAPMPELPAPLAEKTKALVEMPQTATAELSGIIGKDVSGPQVAMAVVAVAGGGAAWKFYQQRQKLKHQERMAEIENERHKNEQKQDDSHQKCATERATLLARVAAAEAKAEEIARKLEQMKSESGSIGLDGFDPDDLEQRIAKLEKALKPSKKR